MRRARLRIRGLVQGVGFRAALTRRARSLGVAGWVRNLSDGTVEAVVEGDPARVDQVIEWCHRGPRGAAVDAVSVAWEEPRGEDGFRVLADGRP